MSQPSNLQRTAPFLYCENCLQNAEITFTVGILYNSSREYFKNVYTYIIKIYRMTILSVPPLATRL